MADKANVTSVDALQSFRTSLLLYVSKARPTLEEISAEILRTRLWLQNDQRVHWESQVRRRTKQLEEAQQALSSARMSQLRKETAAEQLAVRKAKYALDEGEAKLKLLKQWNREFDSRVEPLAKQLEKLHTVLSNDMIQAAAYLSRALDSLAAYAESAPPSAATNPALPSPAAGSTTEDGDSSDQPGRKARATDPGVSGEGSL